MWIHETITKYKNTNTREKVSSSTMTTDWKKKGIHDLVVAMMFLKPRSVLFFQNKSPKYSASTVKKIIVESNLNSQFDSTYRACAFKDLPENKFIFSTLRISVYPATSCRRDVLNCQLSTTSRETSTKTLSRFVIKLACNKTFITNQKPCWQTCDV